jgi:hypothetical protein
MASDENCDRTQTSQEVERQLQAEIAALEMLVETNGVPGAKR